MAFFSRLFLSCGVAAMLGSFTLIAVEEEHAKGYSSHRTVFSRKGSCDLTIVGFVKMADGLGKQSVELIESVKDVYRISFIHTRIPVAQDLENLPRSTRKIIDRSGAKHPGRALIFFDALPHLPGNQALKRPFWKSYGLKEERKDQLRIAYSMFESSRISKGWVFNLNRGFDAVVVPDEFLVKVYKDSGVKLPIFVLPLGVDLKGFLQEPLKKTRHYPFVFATLGTCHERKNQLLLVRAFYEAFGDSPDVQLLLSWRYSFPEYRQAILNEIAALGLHNVKIEEGAIEQSQYIQRYSGIDCLVNISLGEGFSIQPREAMALGIPVILSNNTAQSTICKSGLVEAVPATVEQPALFPFPGDFGVQYNCRVEDVAASLKRVFENFDAHVQKGQNAREWAVAFDYTQLKPLYKSLISPKKITLGRKNAILPGEIMTTSKKLARKWKKVVIGKS